MIAFREFTFDSADFYPIGHYFMIVYRITFSTVDSEYYPSGLINQLF